LIPDNLDDDFDFLLNGVIDSFGILEMISAIEKEFQIQLDLADLDAEQITILGPLSRYVAEEAAFGLRVSLIRAKQGLKLLVWSNLFPRLQIEADKPIFARNLGAFDAMIVVKWPACPGSCCRFTKQNFVNPPSGRAPCTDG